MGQSAISQTSSPNPAPPPLTEGDKRQVLNQLYELQSSRSQILAYDQFIQRETDLSQKEHDNWQRSLDLEKQATALAEKERDMEKEKADLYLSLYNAAKAKKGGIGCALKRIFTLGLARCGS
jgi:hypothetical protein